MEDSVLELVAAYKQGKQDAAFDLHNRYAQPLLKLVRARLNPKFDRRLEPEDVVQSAFRSFFRVVSEDGWVENARAERIWALLAAITINKLNARVRHHSARKRSINHEVPNSAIPIREANGVPEIEAVFFDELTWVISRQSKRHQQILELLLSGIEAGQVAERNGCTLRTVHRVIERTVSQLQNRLDA